MLVSIMMMAGRGSGVRTHDLCVPNAARCRLRHSPVDRVGVEPTSPGRSRHSHPGFPGFRRGPPHYIPVRPVSHPLSPNFPRKTNILSTNYVRATRSGLSGFQHLLNRPAAVKLHKFPLIRVVTLHKFGQIFIQPWAYSQLPHEIVMYGSSVRYPPRFLVIRPTLLVVRLLRPDVMNLQQAQAGMHCRGHFVLLLLCMLHKMQGDLRTVQPLGSVIGVGRTRSEHGGYISLERW